MQEINVQIFRVKLGEKIRNFRKSLDLSQEEMAERSLISMDFLSRIERGTSSPTSLKLTQISKALNVTPNDLLEEFISSEEVFIDELLQKEFSKLTKEDKKAILEIAKYIESKNKNMNELIS